MRAATGCRPEDTVLQYRTDVRKPQGTYNHCERIEQIDTRHCSFFGPTLFLNGKTVF
jgi:hypothetical protein